MIWPMIEGGLILLALMVKIAWQSGKGWSSGRHLPSAVALVGLVLLFIADIFWISRFMLPHRWLASLRSVPAPQGLFAVVVGLSLTAPLLLPVSVGTAAGWVAGYIAGRLRRRPIPGA